MDPKAQLNPGLFFELYLGLLNSNCSRLFQRARRPGQNFNIHTLDENCLYENAAIGEHPIEKMLPTLCEVLGKPKYTNHSIRVTGLRTLRKFDLPVDVMLKFSGMHLYFPNILLSKYFLPSFRNFISNYRSFQSGKPKEL